jgi:hypothetical protein
MQARLVAAEHTWKCYTPYTMQSSHNEGERSRRKADDARTAQLHNISAHPHAQSLRMRRHPTARR